MDWTTTLIILLVVFLINYFGRKTNYPENIDFSEGPVKFKGDPYYAFICLFIASLFAAGSFLSPIWIILVIVIFLSFIYLQFAYFGFFSAITIHPDNSFRYSSPFQKATFQLSDITKIKSLGSALILHLNSGKKICISTILENHENLYGYLFANASEKFSKRAARRIRKKHRFTEVI